MRHECVGKKRNKQEHMKKTIILSAAAALLAVQSATAVPTLIISDNAGHSTGIILDGGAGDGSITTGVITFNVLLAIGILTSRLVLPRRRTLEAPDESSFGPEYG